MFCLKSIFFRLLNGLLVISLVVSFFPVFPLTTVSNQSTQVIPENPKERYGLTPAQSVPSIGYTQNAPLLNHVQQTTSFKLAHVQPTLPNFQAPEIDQDYSLMPVENVEVAESDIASSPFSKLNQMPTQPSSAILLTDPIPEQPSTQSPPFTFFSTSTTLDYQRGSILLAPVNGTELCTDDKAELIVTHHTDGSQAFDAWDYSYPGPGITCTPPIDISYLFQKGLNTLSLNLIDLIPPNYSTSSGYQLLTNGIDIEVLQLYNTKIPNVNGQSVSLLVRMIDLSGGTITNQSVSISDGVVVHQLAPYALSQFGADVYAALFENVPEYKLITITIYAEDDKGNFAQRQVNGYFSNGHFYSLSTCMTSTNPCNSSPGFTYNIGNPVLTYDGAKVETFSLLYVPGPGDADIEISATYNSSDVRLGMFGAAMSSGTDMHLVPLYNPLVPGVEIVMPDGGRFRYEDNGNGSFTAVSPGSEDTLIKAGNEYLYTTHDQISYRFATNGRLLAKQDRNGNTVMYSYSNNQLSTITTGGRTVNLSYNSDGYVETLQIGAKIITLTYDGDKLVGIRDAEGGDWILTYESHEIGEIVDERGDDFAYVAFNHYLTSVTTPAGRIKNEQSYNDDGRVEAQFSSVFGHLDFSYVAHQDGSRETHITDASGVAEIHYYNPLGQLVQRTDRLGNSEYFQFDNNFHVNQKIDFRGYTWTYARDANGNMIELNGPEGLHQAWVYNDFNDPVYFLDGDGYEWEWQYDSNSNLVEFKQPNYLTTTFINNAQGLPTDIFDFNGNHIQNSYDPLNGDWLTITDGEGSTTIFTYDPYGRRATMVLPETNLWIYTYDLNDNLTRVDGSLGYQTQFVYDADDLLTSALDPDQNTLTYVYDERGRLLEERNGENEATFYRYGERNELLEAENARGAITGYSYDQLLRVIQMNSPESVVQQFTYDESGNLLFVTNGRNIVTAITYDGLNRPFALVQNYIENGPMTADTNVLTEFAHDYRANVTHITNPLGGNRTYIYDGMSRLISLENEENETTYFEYDGNGNQIRIIYPKGNQVEMVINGRNQPRLLRDGEGFETLLDYDANGNLRQVIDPDGIVQLYAYNELDQQIAVTDNFVLDAGDEHDLNVTTQFAYSLAGDLTGVVDAENYTFQFGYDGVHRLVQEINPEGQISYGYDEVGNLVSVLDPNSHLWQYEYDLLNRLTAEINPEGHLISYSYDAADNLTEVRDAFNNPTTTAYDPLNRPTIVMNALNYETILTYDALGNVLALIDGNGHTTSFAYDQVQRMLARIDAEGHQIHYGYDQNGRLISQTIPFPNPAQTVVERYAYDGRDLITALTNGENETTRYGYNAVGLLQHKTENDGIITCYDYDHLRRLSGVTLNSVAVTCPGVPSQNQQHTVFLPFFVKGGVTQTAVFSAADEDVAYAYQYDRVGNLESVIDPLGHETTFGFNGLQSLVYERNPIGSEWFYAYDPAQNLIRRTDANGAITHYSYYDDNQLHLINYPHDPDVTYTYDPNNNWLTLQDGLGTTTWQYDPLQRITSVNDSLGRSVAYGYDAVNRTSITYPDGRVVDYAYLDNDWMATVTDPVGGSSRYSYDSAGRVTQVVQPNNTHSTRTYDRAHRLLTLGNYQTNSGDILSTFAYLYDGVGQRVQATNTYGWRNPATLIESYTYDGLRRLTGVTDSEGMIASYAYDRASNRTLWQTNDDPFGSSPTDDFIASYTYDAANRLLTADIERTPAAQSEQITYLYDANGNRIDQLVDGSGADSGMAFAYDDENRMVSAHSYMVTGNKKKNWGEITTMAYDGLGRRLVEIYSPKVNDPGQKPTEYTFDGLDPIAEYDLWNNHKRNYYRGLGNELIQMHNFPAATPGQQYWYHHNGLHSIAGMTKQDGQSTHNYRYDAYGGVIPATGNFTSPHNEYTLTEKAFDSHTNLHYFGARFYDAKTAVWLTQDSYRGKLSNPKSIHRYNYSISNPTNYIDLYGWASVRNDSSTLIYVAVDNGSKIEVLGPGQSRDDVEGIYQNQKGLPQFFEADPKDVVRKFTDWDSIRVFNMQNGSLGWEDVTLKSFVLGVVETIGRGLLSKSFGALSKCMKGVETNNNFLKAFCPEGGWKDKSFLETFNWKTLPENQESLIISQTRKSIKLLPADPNDFKSCALYAQKRRPDLGKAGGDGGAANYIYRPGVFQIKNINTDLTANFQPGYAIIWPKGHSDTIGTEGYEWGHIAIVEKVEVDRVLVSHSNWHPNEMWISNEKLKTLYIYP